MRQIFIHIHIPKCGGTTVENYLQHCFGQGLYNTNSILNDYQYDSDQIRKIIHHYPDLRCLTGHKQSLDLPFEDETWDITAFTWIRDPVARFVSHYFYHRNHTNLVPEAKALQIDDYVTWALDKGNQAMYINGQCKFLAHGDVDAIISASERGRLLLFPLDKMERSFATLKSNWPDAFADAPPVHQNASKKDQNVSEKIRDRIREYVSDDEQLLQIARNTRLEEIPKRGYTTTSQPEAERKLLPRVLRAAAQRLMRGAQKLERRRKV